MAASGKPIGNPDEIVDPNALGTTMTTRAAVDAKPAASTAASAPESVDDGADEPKPEGEPQEVVTPHMAGPDPSIEETADADADDAKKDG